MAPEPLKDSFLVAARAQGGAPEPGRHARLERDLEGLFADASRRWPGVSVEPTAFAAYLGERVTAEQPLTELHASDLFLALACARGDRAALDACDRELLADLPAWVGRIGIRAEDLTELRQRLRAHLFVGQRCDAEAPKPAPRIVAYSGRGPLQGWLRVSAVRLGLKMRRGEREVDEDAALAEQAAPQPDPERAFAAGANHAAFVGAFRAAIAALEDLDRILLRQHHLDGLSLDQLAELHALHRSNLYRRIERARAVVLRETKRRLLASGLTLAECASLIRHAQSELDLTFSSAFGG